MMKTKRKMINLVANLDVKNKKYAILRYFIHHLVTSPLKSPGLHLNST